MSTQHVRPRRWLQVLLAYMTDLRQRGFNQLSLWSCPPLKGDDYILHAHPEEQKTPKVRRRRTE